MYKQTSLFDSGVGNCPIPELDKWTDYLTHSTIINTKILHSTILRERERRTIYPEHHNVFRVFKDMNPKNVSVIILGQDPYHDGNATGYAFACSKSISPSLTQIWDSIKKDTEHTLIDDVAKPNLEYLTKQGVMLLNTILTVEKGKPLSHADKGWENFTKEFIRYFSSAEKNVVYMLWGSSARGYKKYINPVHNLILEHTHPVYAQRQGLHWNCNHFNLCNTYLKSKGKLIINWR